MHLDKYILAINFEFPFLHCDLVSFHIRFVEFTFSIAADHLTVVMSCEVTLLPP